ncbi:hypothetical protein ABZ208_36780 [Streptomyces sp. NPDC006208]|uniref:hypothetical protein n=1 Tax=Streptomyces sp. NPDC006208 TaxID=3156734 RepID=UPI0033A671A5
MGRRRLVGACLAMAVGGMLLSGCGKAAGVRPDRGVGEDVPGLSKQLHFEYIGDSGEDETINQILQITNDHVRSVVPLLSFTALDKNHELLPEVKVSTVYGSERGKLVIPYGTGYDILRFSGPGAHDVADVDVTVNLVVPAQMEAGEHDVTTQALDGQGREISRFERFSKVRLTNEDPYPVWVRVAYVVWDQPAEGDTQQAVDVTPIGGLTRVPPSGTAVVKVTGAAADAVSRNSRGPAVSIKAYNSQ